MKQRRRFIEVFSLSFLDVVSCGFGAIILLLVLSRFAEPLVVERITRDLRGTVSRLENELRVIRDESREVNRRLAVLRANLAREEESLSRLQETLVGVRGRLRAAATDLAARERIRGRLESARQELSEEMRRLRERQRILRPPDGVIGGVPVDSEYIIFVVDTSGSMQRFAWPLIRRKMAEILAIYPQVRGIQVLNDMGDYMFSQYAGRWITDSPARRRAILRRLASWSPFSNSSPVEGITAAIRRFHRPGRRISIYVFGDDFSSGSIQAVVDTVDRLNRSRDRDARLVRIHAVGFPVLFLRRDAGTSVVRFAALMRRLAEDNNGSFVGLDSLAPRRDLGNVQ